MSGLDDFSEAAPVAARDAALDAEQHALACVLCDVGTTHHALDRMADALAPEDFADPRNATVWAAFLAARARRETVDGATTADELTSSGAGPSAVRYLGELARIEADPSLCEQYARRVAERSFLRATQARLKAALERSRKPGQPLEVVSDVRAILSSIPAGVRGQRDDSMLAGAEEAFTEVEAAMLAAKESRDGAASWGVLSLDGGPTREGIVEGTLGGLFPGKLYVIGGVPAAGKTTLAWQAALSTARGAEGRPGRKVLVFSLEMLRSELLKRLSGQMCGIPEARMERGQLWPAEFAAFQNALRELATLPVNIINDARTLEQIRARVLAEKARGDVGLVVVDYLQLVRMERSYDDGNRADEDRVQGAKDLAMEARVPVLAITAMTKAAQREAAAGNVDNTGTKGAGAEYAADVIAFLVRTDPKDPSGSPEVIFAMTKRRGGPCANTTLRFVMPRGRFEEGGR